MQKDGPQFPSPHVHPSVSFPTSGSARPCQKGRDSNEGQGSSRVIFPPVYNTLQSGSRPPGMRYGVVTRPRFHYQQAYIFTCSACVFRQLYTRINITNSREFCTILIFPYKLTCSTHPATHPPTYTHTHKHTHTHQDTKDIQQSH